MTNECCPRFDPNKWDKKTFSWKEKKFIMESVPTLFHIPFPPMIGKKITRMWDLALKSDAALPNKDEALILFRDPSAFRSEIYCSVSKDVKGANNTAISGTFITRVFDGPYNSVPKYIKTMEEYLATKNKTAKDYYIHYAYCPKCAEKNGHNYWILFAQV